MESGGHLGIRPQLNTNVNTQEKSNSQTTCKKQKSKKLKGDQYRPTKNSIVKSGNPKVNVVSNFSPPQLKAFAKIIISIGVSFGIMIISVSVLVYFIGLIR